MSLFLDIKRPKWRDPFQWSFRVFPKPRVNDNSYRSGKGAKDFRDEGCVRNVRREREVTETERKDGREKKRNGKKVRVSVGLDGGGSWREGKKQMKGKKAGR